MVRIVGNEDDRHPGFPSLLHEAQHHAGLLHAQCGGGLVQDEHARAEVDRPGDRHDLPLATGQGADRHLHVRQVHAHLFQLLGGDLPHLVSLQPPQRASELLAQEEVPPHGHLPHHREVLVHGGNPPIEGVLRVAQSRWLPVDQHLAAGGLVQPGERLNQRGLTGTVIAQHAGHGAGADLHVDALEHQPLAVGLLQAAHLDDRRSGAVLGTGGVLISGADRNNVLIGDVVVARRARLGRRHRRRVLPLVIASHLAPPCTREKELLLNTASSSIAPRKNLNQSGFQPA